MTTPTPNAASERDLFEEWCDLTEHNPDNFDLWDAWQAARRTPAAESAAREAVIEECIVAVRSQQFEDEPDNFEDEAYMAAIYDCTRALTKLKAAPTTEGE